MALFKIKNKERGFNIYILEIQNGNTIEPKYKLFKRFFSW